MSGGLGSRTTARCQYRTTKPVGAMSQSARHGSETRYAQCKNAAKHVLVIPNESLAHPGATREVRCCGLHKRMHELYGWLP